MKMSLINYIKKTEFRDSFFDFKNINKTIFFVYTNFFVNHIELLTTLKYMREELN